MKKLLLAIAMSLSLLLTGCSTTTTPQLTDMQIRSITTREINANYKATFDATMAVIQDNGWTIKSADFQTGLITGTTKYTMALPFLETLLTGATTVRKDGTVTATFTKITDNKTKLRLNITDENTINDGATAGRTYTTRTLEPEIYNRLFGKITVETERIKALN